MFVLLFWNTFFIMLNRLSATSQLCVFGYVLHPPGNSTYIYRQTRNSLRQSQNGVCVFGSIFWTLLRVSIGLQADVDSERPQTYSHTHVYTFRDEPTYIFLLGSNLI